VESDELGSADDSDTPLDEEEGKTDELTSAVDDSALELKEVIGESADRLVEDDNTFRPDDEKSELLESEAEELIAVEELITVDNDGELELLEASLEEEPPTLVEDSAVDEKTADEELDSTVDDCTEVLDTGPELDESDDIELNADPELLELPDASDELLDAETEPEELLSTLEELLSIPDELSVLDELLSTLDELLLCELSEL